MKSCSTYEISGFAVK